MIYLNNAASSFPKPESVYKTMMTCMKSCASAPGRGSKVSKNAKDYVTGTRELLAGLFNAESPERIIFTLNDTYALNFAIKGVLKPGDHVIISCLEHNSIIRPLMELENYGILNTVVNTTENGELDTKDIENALTPSTKLIAAAHASNVIGTILPIKEIGLLCKRHGIMYLVDAAQTAGILPLDVKDMNISLMAFPGHKSLLGPMGTGGLYIASDVDIKDIIQGGTGTVSENPFQPQTMPDRFESGTHNVPGIAGLGAGVEFIKRAGMNAIRKHEMALTKEFIRNARQIRNIKVYGTDDMGIRVSTVALNVGDMLSNEVSSILRGRFGIITRGGLHCAPFTHRLLGTTKQGAVRFSFGYFNNEKDIENALRALHHISKKSNH